MKIINVNYNSDFYADHYEPISINDEFLIMAGIHRDEEDGTKYTGFYKYNLKSDNISRFGPPTQVTEYFPSKNKDEIFYYYAEPSNKEYILHFYKYNIKTQGNTKFNEYRMKRYWQDFGDGEYYQQAPDKIYLDVLNDRYILIRHMFKAGVVAEERSDGFYIAFDQRLTGEIKEKEFIFDIMGCKAYEIMDKSFIGDGAISFQISNVEGKDYLTAKTYKCEIEDDSNDTSEDENLGHSLTYRYSIKITPVEDFINGIIHKGRNNSFMEVYIEEDNRQIRFIKAIDTKIYYEVYSNDNNPNRFVTYDISSNSYSNLAIQEKYFKIDSVADSIYVASFQDNNCKVTNLIKSEEHHCFKVLQAPIFLEGFINNRYFVFSGLKVVNNGKGIKSICQIYDGETGAFIDEIFGHVKVFEEESTIIIY